MINGTNNSTLKKLNNIISPFHSNDYLKVIILLIFLIASVFIFVFASMKKQNIQSEASNSQVLQSTSPSTNEIRKYKGYIVKLRSSSLLNDGSKMTNDKKNKLKEDRESFKQQIIPVLGRKGIISSRGANEKIDNNLKKEYVKILNEYDIIFNGLSLDITDQEAEVLKSNPLVEKIYKNYQYKTNLYESSPLIKAPFVFDKIDSNGRKITGQGVKIAIIDTGVDFTHEDLGSTVIKEREFFKVPIKNPEIYDTLTFQLLDNKLAYYLWPNKINIYDFNTNNTKEISLNTSNFFRNPELLMFRYNGKYIVHYSYTMNNRAQGAIFIYNIETGSHRKIADLTFKGTNWVDVGNIAISDKYVFYAKAKDNNSFGHQRYKLYKYNISTETSSVIVPDLHNSWFVQNGNKVAYMDPSTSNNYYDCKPRSIIVQNVNDGIKKTTFTNNMGRIEDFNYGHIAYLSPCPEDANPNTIFLYDLNSDTEKKITYNKDITGKEIGQQSSSPIFLYEIPVPVRIGDGVVFFYKNMFTTTQKLIAYDYRKDTYAQITLNPGLDVGLIAEGGKVCFTKAYSTYEGIFNYRVLCHDYNPNYSYPLPSNIFNKKVIDGFDFLTGEKYPIDENGHGTHVAGIAAGSGNIKGIAPGAQIVAYKVLDAYGEGFLSDVLDAVDMSVGSKKDDDQANDIDVMNLSLGGYCGEVYFDECGPDDLLSLALDTAVDAGISVVVAAGNAGPNKGTITSPATSRKAMAVGSVNKDKTISEFSSRGQFNGDLKSSKSLIF